MSSIIGDRLKLTLFGESHGPAVGIVIDGLPSGIPLDLDYMKFEMERRRPGRGCLSSSRDEDDEFKIISGYFEGKTTGAPLCGLIPNKDQQPEDYIKIKDIMRPGHADYTAFAKYEGYNDYRGGGLFSGRLTAPLVFAGGIAKQILEKLDIYIGSHIKSIKDISVKGFDKINVSKYDILELRAKDFPVIDETIEEKMRKCIMKAKIEKDSVGGIIETAVVNLDTGYGKPFFNCIESNLSKILFSIPSVKGVEFGDGFNMTTMRGSEANDEYMIIDEEIRTSTNHCGGVLGGLTTGMPLIFSVAIKPTSSISSRQKTVDVNKLKEVEISIKGRHDPCIVPRAVPVVEAVTATTILDFIIDRESEKGISKKLRNR
ncbi:MAG TPA: chorismate synthase [Thermoanaerobacterales bacterium]|nr:chorismate synthase [Thermoanaerobacterales bacterium]